MRVIAVTAIVAVSACGRIGFDASSDSNGSMMGDGRGSDSASATHTFEFEAESGTLVPPFAIVEDTPTNPGLFYVLDGNPNGSMGGAGGVGFTFEIVVPGTYYLWTRSNSHTNGTDSSFASVDQAAPRQIQMGNCIYDMTWHWGAWEQFTDCASPKIGFAFTAGFHELDITSREGGMRVDRLLWTDDASLVPTN